MQSSDFSTKLTKKISNTLATIIVKDFNARIMSEKFEISDPWPDLIRVYKRDETNDKNTLKVH